MSAEELRQYCESLHSFNLTVTVRLKNSQDTVIGRITFVNTQQIHVTDEDNIVQEVPFAWVATVKTRSA